MRDITEKKMGILPMKIKTRCHTIAPILLLIGWVLISTANVVAANQHTDVALTDVVIRVNLFHLDAHSPEELADVVAGAPLKGANALEHIEVCCNQNDTAGTPAFTH